MRCLDAGALGIGRALDGVAAIARPRAQGRTDCNVQRFENSAFCEAYRVSQWRKALPTDVMSARDRKRDEETEQEREREREREKTATKQIVMARKWEEEG